LIVLLALVVIGLDQWTKYFIQSHLLPGMSIPVIPHVFHITYVLNSGAAFSLLEHQTGLFIGIALVILLAIAWYYPRIAAGPLLLRIAIGLQAGGAIGNLIDRIKTGYVVDFLDFRIWPVFNVADMAIVVGVGLILVQIFYLSGKEGDNR